MNAGYVLWFAALVVVVGAALVWFAIGEVPGIPADREVDADREVGADPEVDADAEPDADPGAPEVPGRASEPAGEDGVPGAR